MQKRIFKFSHESKVLTDEHCDFLIFNVEAEDPDTFCVTCNGKVIPFEFLNDADRTKIQEEIDDRFMDSERYLLEQAKKEARELRMRNIEYYFGLVQDLNEVRGVR